VGFASLPLDRFAGLRPVKVSAQSTLRKPLENIGQITLKPISLDDVKHITINANAQGGAIRVEVLSSEGYRVRGFAKEDAKPLTGDSLKHALSWQKRTLEDLPPGQYMIRLHLENAEVFAVTLQE
jgi:hypothetical protein